MITAWMITACCALRSESSPQLYPQWCSWALSDTSQHSSYWCINLVKNTTPIPGFMQTSAHRVAFWTREALPRLLWMSYCSTSLFKATCTTALVRQATNVGARRPGNKAIIYMYLSVTAYNFSFRYTLVGYQYPKKVWSQLFTLVTSGQEEGNHDMLACLVAKATPHYLVFPWQHHLWFVHPDYQSQHMVLVTCFPPVLWLTLWGAIGSCC